MSSVLVTGASGFIGGHLVPRLREQGDDVVAADSRSGDVTKEATWQRFPAADIVVHLAGRPFVPESWQQPEMHIRCNFLGTIGALEYARMHGAFLVFMSSYLYGRPGSLPIPETAPIVATNPYSLSKKLAEEACRFYSDAFGVDVAILRPFNVYGPGQAESFLVPGIVRQVTEGAVIRVKDLEPRRDYVYVADVADAIIKTIAARSRFSVVNIGSGISHSVRELVDLVQSVSSTRLPVVSDEERRRDEIMDTVADITRAKQHLGWSPRWTLRDGLAATLSATASRQPLGIPRG